MAEENAVTEQLLKAGARIETLEDLMNKCLPTVAARLWQTCCWGHFQVGDFRYVIFSVRPDPETSLFVQFWSEPHEVILCEVCSGNWTPGAIKYLSDEGRRAIEARSFVAGGRAGNYVREVMIASTADAKKAARETLAIFFDAFAYRGQWEFEIERGQGSRATPQPVYNSLTPEDFAKLAVEVGYKATEPRMDPSAPVVVLQKGRRRSTASFELQVPDNNLFAAITLRAGLTAPAKTADARLSVLNNGLRGARLGRDDDGGVFLERSLRIAGGVTANWLMNEIRYWSELHSTAERLLARLPVRSGLGQRTDSGVH